MVPRPSAPRRSIIEELGEGQTVPAIGDSQSPLLWPKQQVQAYKERGRWIWRELPTGDVFGKQWQPANRDQSEAFERAFQGGLLETYDTHVVVNPRAQSPKFVREGLKTIDTISEYTVGLPSKILHHAVDNPADKLYQIEPYLGYKENPEEKPGKKPRAKASTPVALLVENSGNEKVGSNASATYMSNIGCPNKRNSSRPCPFLGFGCYAEYGNVGIARLRVNKGAARAKADPVVCAQAEADAIRAQIEKNNKTGKWKPLRLHVVGDAIGDKAARIIADACEGWKEKVWVYTHAWRQTSRSAWGSKISVLASVETPKQAKLAMSRGWVVAMVIEKFKQPGWYRDEENGINIQPCPNESVSKNTQCVGGEPGKKACGMCLNENRLRSRQDIIAFDAHSGGAEKIRIALRRILAKEAKQGVE